LGGFGEDNAKEDVGVAEPDDFCALEHEPERDDRDSRDEAGVEGVVIDVDYTEHIENDEEEQLPDSAAVNFQVQAGPPRLGKKKRKLEFTDQKTVSR
jgi:hypothetical protein